MGSRTPHVLVDTTPAKTIVVYRNGDQFYVGRKFVLSRRRVATFEALLEQLTEQVQAPFGVRRLFTPTRGHPVRELDALQAGGKYVAAGRERFKKLDYIHIVPRKPAKMRKLKDVKPVVHCDISVPSRWQTSRRLSRPINVFTNGRLFFPPVKIIIPRFCLTDWNCVLAVIGEKVFPLGGVRKLFTMNGHLLEDSKELQDNHFYVAVGLETFKRCPYWKSPRVPSAVRQKYSDMEKYSRRKKKEEPKEKETQTPDSFPPQTQDSVFYAKEGQKPNGEPFTPSRADGGVYKAQTLDEDTSGALEIKEAPDVPVDVPVDQKPAEMVKEVEETHRNSPDFESNKEDNSPMSFKKEFLLRHNTEKEVEGCSSRDVHPRERSLWAGLSRLPFRRLLGPFPAVEGPEDLSCWLSQMQGTRNHLLSGLFKNTQRLHRRCTASLKNLSKNQKAVSVPEKEPNDILEEKNTPVLLETPMKIEDQRKPPGGQQSQEESSPGQPEVQRDTQASLEPSSLGQPSQGQAADGGPLNSHPETTIHPPDRCPGEDTKDSEYPENEVSAMA